MGIEYIAAIQEDDYEAFKTMILTPQLPDDYGMWLRVRERGKLRALKERLVMFGEVEVSPVEFRTYCKGFKRRDFSVASLDRCARTKVRVSTAITPQQAPVAEANVIRTGAGTR